MKGTFKRILYSSGAVVVAAALAVGGTFAYRNWERKSNVLTGKAQHQAKLVENYEKNPEWAAEVPIKKEVKVRNMGGVGQYTGKNWGDIYVGIRLLEYLDTTPYTYTYITGEDTSKGTGSEPIRFMINTNGEFVRFPVSAVDFEEEDEAVLRAAIKAAYNWSHVIEDKNAREAFIDSLVTREFLVVSGLYDKNAAGDPVDYYYLPTKAGDPNGQYGAYVVKSAEEDVSKRTVITTTSTPGLIGKRLNADGQTIATNADYLKYYQPHLWTAGAENSLVHEYISIVLGEEDVDWVFLSNFKENKDYGNGGVWILDDSADSEGWAYWSEPLPPGKYTDLLVKQLRPLVAPEESIYYDLYVLMEAYSKDEIPENWPTYKAPTQVFRVDPASGKLELGETLGFTSSLDGQDKTAVTTWTLHDTMPAGGASLIMPASIGDPNTTPGGSTLTGTDTVTLTVGETETAKTLYIKAVHGDYWKIVTVTVEDNTPPPTGTDLPLQKPLPTGPLGYEPEQNVNPDLDHGTHAKVVSGEQQLTGEERFCCIPLSGILGEGVTTGEVTVKAVDTNLTSFIEKANDPVGSAPSIMFTWLPTGDSSTTAASKFNALNSAKTVVAKIGIDNAWAVTTEVELSRTVDGVKQAAIVTVTFYFNHSAFAP